MSHIFHKLLFCFLISDESNKTFVPNNSLEQICHENESKLITFLSGLPILCSFAFLIIDFYMKRTVYKEDFFKIINFDLGGFWANFFSFFSHLGVFLFMIIIDFSFLWGLGAALRWDYFSKISGFFSSVVFVQQLKPFFNKLVDKLFNKIKISKPEKINKIKGLLSFLLMVFAFIKFCFFCTQYFDLFFLDPFTVPFLLVTEIIKKGKNDEFFFHRGLKKRHFVSIFILFCAKIC